jgi:hypothetical protein
LSNLRDSNRIPGVFITGESITNTHNSSNILKYSKSFLGMPMGTKETFFDEKKGE